MTSLPDSTPPGPCRQGISDERADDFYTRRGLGPAVARREAMPRQAPKALSQREVVRYLRAVEHCGCARDTVVALLPLTRPELRTALTTWLEQRPAWPGAAASPALLLNRRGARLSDRSARSIVTDLGTQVGLGHDTGTGGGFGPHVLRHTFATQLIRADSNEWAAADDPACVHSAEHQCKGVALLAVAGAVLIACTPAPAPPATSATAGATTGGFSGAVVMVSLGTDANEQATVYVGRLSDVVRALAGRVTLATDPAFASAHQDVCVDTVVFTGVPGSSAVVYAGHLDDGWTAAENAPATAVEGSEHAVHQQLVVPPSTAKVGRSWTLNAELAQDGQTVATSGSYTLTVLTAAPGRTRWAVGPDSGSVECSPT